MSLLRALKWGLSFAYSESQNPDPVQHALCASYLFDPFLIVPSLFTLFSGCTGLAVTECARHAPTVDLCIACCLCNGFPLDVCPLTLTALKF